MNATQNWVVRAPGVVDRIEARFSGTAYAPHRHDTYAIGLTLKGVQSFDYRGATRRSLTPTVWLSAVRRARSFQTRVMPSP